MVIENPENHRRYACEKIFNIVLHHFNNDHEIGELPE